MGLFEVCGISHPVVRRGPEVSTVGGEEGPHIPFDLPVRHLVDDGPDPRHCARGVAVQSGRIVAAEPRLRVRGTGQGPAGIDGLGRRGRGSHGRESDRCCDVSHVAAADARGGGGGGGGLGRDARARGVGSEGEQIALTRGELGRDARARGVGGGGRG